jgi:hypothetical protein
MLGNRTLIGEGGIFKKPTICHFDENLRLIQQLRQQYDFLYASSLDIRTASPQTS